jgi:hypothetical protein
MTPGSRDCQAECRKLREDLARLTAMLSQHLDAVDDLTEVVAELVKQTKVNHVQPRKQRLFTQVRHGHEDGDVS